jgi:hypothetical protein
LKILHNSLINIKLDNFIHLLLNLMHELGSQSAIIDTLTEDASDALAVALCHHYQMVNRLGSTKAGGSGWASFIKQNPARLLTKK